MQILPNSPRVVMSIPEEERSVSIRELNFDQPLDRVVIRTCCVGTTNDAGLSATANLTTFRFTSGIGGQILCEETLEFLGITQNIHCQEFVNDSNKNEIHICIISNTVGRTQKQTCCSFHITWKPKTTVFLLKIKRQKKPVAYYSNTSATQKLILSGDIEENPGPIQDKKPVEAPAAQRIKTKPKCPNCTKTVQSNHKRFLCTVCLDLYHAKCINLKGNELRNIRADNPQDWLCTKCQITTLPFFNCQQEEFLNAITDHNNNIANNPLEDLIDEHLEALTSKSKQLKLMHLNTQSMVSTFDELLVTIKEYPFDVVAMSETWMKNNPHLLQYVSIPGYTNLFRNRDEIRGGGVGLYIKNSINFKRRTDIEKIEPELEQMWVKISGRNKNSQTTIRCYVSIKSDARFSNLDR